MSRLGFLSKGVTRDCLKLDGKLPVDSDKLTMFVIVGARTGRHFFNSDIGSGSRSHCLSGRRRMMVDISSAVASGKVSNAVGAVAGAGKCGEA